MNQVAIPELYCPTRRQAGMYPFDPAWQPINAAAMAMVAKLDYAVNAGDVWISATGPSSYAQADDPSYVWTDFSRATGVSYFRSSVTPADIQDGLSMTYLFGEKNVSTATGFQLGDDQAVFVGYDLDNSRWTSFDLPPTADGAVIYADRFGSRHPTTCQFSFCDGSVRALSYSIDPEIHRRLGNRSDGDAVTSNELP